MGQKTIAIQTGLAAALMLIAASASAADIWKCTIDGRAVWSDKPCPSSGTAVEARQMQGNVVQAIKPPKANVAAPELPNTALASRPANVCPDELELRNMQTQANSISLGPDEKAFLLDEIRRARQCLKGEGQYTADDWRISREAQAAQANNVGRREARARAEAVHSAADPLEGERIARLREQAAADQRLAAALQRGRAASGGGLAGPRDACRWVGEVWQCP